MENDGTYAWKRRSKHVHSAELPCTALQKPPQISQIALVPRRNPVAGPSRGQWGQPPGGDIAVVVVVVMTSILPRAHMMHACRGHCRKGITSVKAKHNTSTKVRFSKVSLHQAFLHERITFFTNALLSLLNHDLSSLIHYFLF